MPAAPKARWYSVKDRLEHISTVDAAKCIGKIYFNNNVIWSEQL